MITTSNINLKKSLLSIDGVIFLCYYMNIIKEKGDLILELKDIYFKEIDRESTKPFLLNKHYLKRMPPLSIAFGAFYKDDLIGVLTFGKPPSNALCRGVCGDDFSSKVFELNRLYTIDSAPKNTESRFISYALKQLKDKNLIIISYADKAMNHSGYIYQATNWMYTGFTQSRTDIYVGKNNHSKNYTPEQQSFVVRSVRSQKHRYIYICGDKRFKKSVLENLNYPIYNEYPKGEVYHYNDDSEINKLLYNKNTKEVFLEKDFIENPLSFITLEEYNDYLKIYN